MRVLFFSARQLSHFMRQVAHFTRSWSSCKMLAVQPRGFVFEPMGMRLFFTSFPKQKVLTLFGTMRLFGFVRLFRNFSTPKSPPFNFLIFCNRTNVKNPKGSFLRLPSLFCCFFSKIFNVYKGFTLLFVWYLATERMLKNPKGSLFSDFLALWDCH